ncbi:MAG TPA: MerR family transcriptional regulator [Tepidiformaceae bacterium]|nr:MerR family transcriptional regulator [Tepidiformaceae bacterium]
MKISELSARTGVTIPTLKFYLREGLLPQGELSAPNQAEYSERHVRRAALIRSLREVAGLSIARITAIVAALEQGEATYEVLGAAVDSLGGAELAPLTPPQEQIGRELDALLASLGLPTRPESLGRYQIIIAFESIRAMLFPNVPIDILALYARPMMDVARAERSVTPDLIAQDPETSIERAVIGLALFEPIILAFRRLTHEAIMGEEVGAPGGHDR